MPAEQLIFTDWPRGKGVDPSASGFQIVACSEGLGADARRSLSNLCMHLGQAYSAYNAPRAAVQQEQSWLAQTVDRTRVPEEVLEAFPVIWSYDWLGPDQAVLARARYTGFAHDGRTGNFFVHALVFDPLTLEGAGDNPLALARSRVFQTEVAGGETTLPALDSLAPGHLPAADLGVLAEEPYRGHLAAMLSALCSARQARRPVLVCLADWRAVAALAEALLDLVPPAERRILTFCTYESDRTWVLSSRSGRPTGAEAARQLIFLCGPGDRSWNLRMDEYQSVYAVFNFAEGKISELGSPRPYATFAATCALAGDRAALHAYHRLLEQLGVAADQDAWDRLAPAACLMQPSATPDMLSDACRALAGIAQNPQSARVALGLLLPSVAELARADNFAALAALAPGLATLSSRLPAPAASPVADDPTAMLQLLVDEAVAAGHAQTAAALLRAYGPARDSALLALLNRHASQPATRMAVPSSADAAAEWIHLLHDALRLVERQPEPKPPVEWLALAAFHAGRVSKLSADVWSQFGESPVKRLLGGAWSSEKEAFARKLVHELPPLECPEGSAWLNLRLLREAKPQGAELETRLVTLTQAAARSSLASEAIPEVIRVARRHWEEPERLTVGLGRLVEAAFGTPSQSALETAYHEALNKVAPSQVGRVRRKLADAGAEQLLCKAFFADVLPWTTAEGPSELQRWYDTALSQSPSLLNAVLQSTAGMVQDPRQRERSWPLAEEILFRHGAKDAQAAGYAALGSAVALALPLAPLPEQWDSILAGPKARLAPDAQARVRVMGFMRQVEQRVARTSWGPAAFPVDEPVWRSDVGALPATDRRQLVSWCASLFTECGVVRPEDARGLVAILAAAGEDSPSAVASAVEQLLMGRDPVTAVLVAAAFATCALEEPDAAAWVQSTREIVDRLDRDTRQLFVAHLKGRFGRRDLPAEQALETLLSALDLAMPTLQMPGPPADEATADQKKEADLSGVQQLSARFKEKLKWSQLLAPGKQNPAKPEEPKKD